MSRFRSSGRQGERISPEAIEPSYAVIGGQSHQLGSRAEPSSRWRGAGRAILVARDGMARITLIHCIFREKLAVPLSEALADIRTHQRLLAGYGTHGYGVYAFFADQVPAEHRDLPAVEFEIDDEQVSAQGPPWARFAFIRVPFREAHLPIIWKGFLNVP